MTLTSDWQRPSRSYEEHDRGGDAPVSLLARFGKDAADAARIAGATYLVVIVAGRIARKASGFFSLLRQDEPRLPIQPIEFVPGFPERWGIWPRPTTHFSRGLETDRFKRAMEKAAKRPAVSDRAKSVNGVRPKSATWPPLVLRSPHLSLLVKFLFYTRARIGEAITYGFWPAPVDRWSAKA